ncbi:MAG: GFA family protein [Solirubrobacterales bacterium]|nr:GFA family protein [Solirubrobacterales bacterium]HMT05481.1 GFA family protein [Solirubrobacterales bacterium]
MDSSAQNRDPGPAEHMTGECMCGIVTFEVNQPLIGAALCYCKRCQRRTGTGVSATGLTQPGSFVITAGEKSVRVYEPGDGGFNKYFCGECGGHLYTCHPDNPDILAIRLGALNEDPGIRPLAHQFTDYAAPWFPVPEDDLPKFPERLDWSQVDLG